MLRLHVCCTPIAGSSFGQVKIGTRHGSWLIQTHREWRIFKSVTVKALKEEPNEGTKGLPGQRWDPGLEMEVPFEQRPVCMPHKSIAQSPL